MTDPAQFFVHEEGDDVAVAVTDLEPGTARGRFLRTGAEVSAELVEAIELGHKFALRDLDEGSHVVKEGLRIGVLTKPVRSGEKVHVHNLVSALWRPTG